MYVIYGQEFENVGFFFLGYVISQAKLEARPSRAHAQGVSPPGVAPFSSLQRQVGPGAGRSCIIGTGWSCGSMFNRLFLGTSSRWNTLDWGVGWGGGAHGIKARLLGLLCDNNSNSNGG